MFGTLDRSHMLRFALILASLTHPTAMAGDPADLVYSGRKSWDAAAGILIFQSSGTMPESKEGFHWVVPDNVRQIVIGERVTVRGAFRVPYRNANNPLLIVGRNRETSVLYGTDTEHWTAENKIDENDKWKYGAVSVLADAVVRVSDLTSQNPRGYNISGYANQAVLHVSRCNLLDTRNGDNNNSDGFIGAAGSSITDSLISTSDDGIKIYRDVTIKNVTIEQHRNGAPIQFGWGGESAHAKATIEGLTIRGVDPQNLYNMAPFTWEAGTSGTRDVTVTGLKVNLIGKLYDESSKTWRPMGLFELKPKGCTLNITIVDAEAKDLGTGIRNTQGTMNLNGATLR
ncbi:MAG: hypothetical protein ACRC1K_19325 [Planctomycetia bacterium]